MFFHCTLIYINTYKYWCSFWLKYLQSVKSSKGQLPTLESNSAASKLTNAIYPPFVENARQRMWLTMTWSHEWFAHLQHIQQTRFVTYVLTSCLPFAKFLQKPFFFYAQSLPVFHSWESDARSMPRFIQLFVKASIFRMLPQCDILRWHGAYLFQCAAVSVRHTCFQPLVPSGNRKFICEYM